MSVKSRRVVTVIMKGLNRANNCVGTPYTIKAGCTFMPEQCMQR